MGRRKRINQKRHRLRNTLWRTTNQTAELIIRSMENWAHVQLSPSTVHGFRFVHGPFLNESNGLSCGQLWSMGSVVLGLNCHRTH